MKALIWILCYLSVAIVMTVARQKGVILGALPMMILFGGGAWLARSLCKRWDKRKKNEEGSGEQEL